MIKPTVGRIVWFWREGIFIDGMMVQPDCQPEFAKVCFVHDDNIVNLQVTNKYGVSRPELSVYLKQATEQVTAGRFCEWMPYQQGQAAKTEALEAQLKAK